MQKSKLASDEQLDVASKLNNKVTIDTKQDVKNNNKYEKKTKMVGKRTIKRIKIFGTRNKIARIKR